MSSILKLDTLQDTGGNTILSSDGSGNITIPNGVISGQNYPAFEVFLTQNSNNISDDTDTKIQFDGTVYDTNSYWDGTTNYRYTPLVAGKYYVYGNIFCASASQVERARIEIRFNGNLNTFSTRYSRSQFNGSVLNIEPNNVTLNISQIMEMNGSTDYIELYARINDNGNSNGNILGGANGLSNFGAYRIGS